MQRHDVGCVLISIHALLAESDTSGSIIPAIESISIHALLAESDPELLAWETKNLTPISIHALLAESDDGLEEIEESAFIISIHALLAESDRLRQHKPVLVGISIHALLAESDTPRAIW